MKNTTRGAARRPMTALILLIALMALTTVATDLVSPQEAEAYCNNFHVSKTLSQSWGVEASNDNCNSPAYYSGKIRDNGANNGACAWAVFGPRFETSPDYFWQGSGCSASTYTGYSWYGVYNSFTGQTDQTADIYVCNGYTPGGIPTALKCGAPKIHYPG